MLGTLAAGSSKSAAALTLRAEFRPNGDVSLTTARSVPTTLTSFGARDPYDAQS